MAEKKWEIICTSPLVINTSQGVVDVLLKNRGFIKETEKQEFLNPVNPAKVKLANIKVNSVSLKKALKKIKEAVLKNEEIIIYGDYDADGVCATAILWETLFSLTKNVLPYIPNRFSEGYGINPKSIEKIKSERPNTKLIITVDNGIVAFDAIKKANSLGIDVIITDHHAKEIKVPRAFSIVHTGKLSGSGVSWILSREIKKDFKGKQFSKENDLELAAIGTVADQLPLTRVNRSIVKYGIRELGKTNRPGLKALFEESGLKNIGPAPHSFSEVGTYEINYVIAPRINAVGRMGDAIDSLRLICTKDPARARELANFLGKTNRDRQKVVEDVVTRVIENVKSGTMDSAIVISGKFHEGVIGLAAGKLVEVFYLPSIVISEGEEVSKASARSITGFNIIKAIRKLSSLIEGGGGHEMAAGFSIRTKNIEKFKKEFTKIAKQTLTIEILKKKLKIDMKIDFKSIDDSLSEKLKEFNPTGIGNPTPTFLTQGVDVIDAKTVGAGGKHLKMYLNKEGFKFNAIGFNLGNFLIDFSPDKKIDIVYTINENVWNGERNLQLGIRDIKVAN